MRMHVPGGLLGAVAALVAVSAAASTEPHERSFQIRYRAAITGVPAAAKTVRVWLPAPQSDAWQTVSNVSIESPYPHSLKREAEYGNEILSFEGPPPAGGSLDIVMTFDVARREYVNRPGSAAPAPAEDHEDARLLARFRQPDIVLPGPPD